MEGDDILKNVGFSPSKSITFQPLLAKQKTECEITNHSSVDILVKWKLTRPGVFRTVPTFSIIRSGESATTTLICNGITKEEASLNRDRFSIIVAPIRHTELTPKSIWKDREALQMLTIGKIQKKMIFILYAGINDTLDLSKTETVQDVNDVDEHESKEDFMESGKESERSNVQLKTTRTAGNFTCQFIPIAQLGSPRAVKSPSG